MSEQKLRDCICADPENCTQAVPGYRCRKSRGSSSQPPTSDEGTLLTLPSPNERSTLTDDIRQYLRQLSPHVREREAARLLQLAVEAIGHWRAKAHNLERALHASDEGVPKPPRWYTRNEIVDTLKRMRYHETIAQELADWIVRHLQGAFNKGFQKGLAARSPKLEELIPHGAAITNDGTVYYKIARLEQRADEYECAMRCLDDANVPRGGHDGKQFNEYSLWGRIKQFAALQSVSAAPQEGKADDERRIKELASDIVNHAFLQPAGDFRASIRVVEELLRLNWRTPPAATDGFVRVPREPTPEMIKTGREIFHLFVHDGCVQPMYKAMIDAAPQGGKKEDGQ